MKALVPPALRPGDRIGIAAPGGPVRSEALARGMAYLESRGFRTVEAPHLRDRAAYLAGADADRLADLNRFFADDTIAAIWCARGGYGSARIVEGLDFTRLKRRPKAIVGYSDVTVLHAAAWTAVRLVTWHGPLVAELGDPALFDEPALWRALSEPSDLTWPLEPAQIVRAGAGEGPILGGCLSLLVALVGTPYEPPLDGAILFWEDVHEEPYKIDRMLGHLRMAGRLKQLKGMIVGRLIDAAPADAANVAPLRDILARHVQGTDFPVVIDFPAGHAPGKTTLPLGARARLDTAGRALTVRR